MALRLPQSARSVRRPTRTRRTATVIFAALVFAILPIRLLLGAAEIATWTAAWRTVDYLSTPFVVVFGLVDPLDLEIVGRVTAADVAALIVWGGVAIYLLALLTVRRQR